MAGASVSIEHGLLRVKAVFDMLSKGATGFPGSPATYGIILDRYEKPFKEAIKTLKFIVINSSPLPINLANKIMELIPNKNYMSIMV